MKKAFSVILTAIFIFNMFSANAAESTDKTVGVNMAEAVLTKSGLKSDFNVLDFGKGGEAEIVQKCGESGWQMNKQKTKEESCISIAFDKTFKNGRDGSVYSVSVEYFDEGKGFFNLIYDSLEEEEKLAGAVYLKNTSVWKTAEFELDDAMFSNRLSGKYDMRLSVYEAGSNVVSDSSVTVRRISVKRFYGKNPVFVSAKTNRPGNSYEWFAKNKIITNTFENLTDKNVNLKVSYIFESLRGYDAFEKTENLSLEPFEKKDKNLDFGELERCDIYWYKVKIESNENNINSQLVPLQIAVLKTDPNGVKNYGAYFAAHIERYPEEQRNMAWQVFAMSNMGGTRFGVTWWDLEAVTGTLNWDKTNIKKMVDKVKENGLSLIAIMGSPPNDYGGMHTMPKTEKNLEGWRRYCRYAATVLKDYTDCFEIWNEPNLKNFNTDLEASGGDVYMKMFKAAAEEIHAANPDAMVGGPSLTGIEGSLGNDYYDAVLENGFADAADALVLHPYTTVALEKSSMPKVVKKYKDEFIEKSGRTPEIWHTETGYTLPDANIGTERVKGALNARAAIYYKEHGLGDKVVFYNFEKKGTVETDREHMFGHVSPGYLGMKKYGTWFLPSESYLIITAMNYLMANTTADSYYESQNGNLYLSKFKSEKFDSDLIAMYTKGDAENFSVDLGAEKITFFDEYGNETEIWGENGIYTFTADNCPKYIMGNIPHMKVLEEENTVKYNSAAYSAPENDLFRMEITNLTEKKLNIETETPKNIEPVENSGFKDNKAQIKFKNLCPKGETSYITVILKDNEGKVVQKSSFDVVSDEIVSSKMRVELCDISNPNVWNGVLEITNHSAEKTLTGYAVFSAPETFKETGKTDIGIIPPGQTGKATFSLPLITRKGQYNPNYKIFLNGSEAFDFIGGVDFTLAKYAENKPKIDGKTDKGEWNLNTAMYADNAEQVKQMSNWRGADDLSGKSMVMWDEDNFYMCAIVKDDVHVNVQPADKNWNGDSMQFGVFYGEQGFVAIGQATSTFHEVCISKSSLNGEVYAQRYLSQDDSYPAGELEGAECAVSRSGSETVYEIRIPWEKLLRKGDKPKEGDKLGYSFLFNDSDDEVRKGWIEYASGIGEIKDTSLFTYMTLIR